jgi:hypothetical protein
MDLEETEARNDCAGEVSSNLTDRPTREEVDSNTYTVTLRVVGGDEKGTPCLGV